MKRENASKKKKSNKHIIFVAESTENIIKNLNFVAW